MTLEARKLDLVNWVVNSMDEQLIATLEKFRKEQKIKTFREGLKPMTEEELLARAEASEEAIRQGKTVDVEDLLKEMEHENF